MNRMTPATPRQANDHMGASTKTEELYDKVRTALTESHPDNTSRARALREALALCALEGTEKEGQAFGNLFSRVDFLCRKHGMKTADRMAVQEARRHGNDNGQTPSWEELRYDARAVSLFISAVTGVPVPHELLILLPANPKPRERQTGTTRERTRCVVLATEGEWMSVIPDEQGGRYAVNLRDESRGADNTYISSLVREGTQVNLLDCRVEDTPMKVAGKWCDKRVTPRLIVVEPDYLVDISSIAACFTEMGLHPLRYLLNLMKPRQTTQAILLGNLAGAALDDIINSSHYRFEDTLRNHFADNAIDFCACADFRPAEFKTQARQQAANLEATRDTLSRQYPGERFLLEPSFLCEALGLRGRADLMTTDCRLLVEQKSGKNLNIERHQPDPTHHGFQLTSHYTQLLLYYGVLRYNFHLPPDAVDTRLLYSRFPPRQGLLVVAYYQKLFLEAMAYRNQVVGELLDIARRGFAVKLPHFNSEALNTAGNGSPFVTRYKIPEIRAVTDPIHQATSLERAYFCRMVTHVVREDIMAKMGGQEGVTHCAADLWNMPLAEKREAGTIYTGLRVTRKARSQGHKGYDTLTLSVPRQPGEDFLSNFRQGDMAWLYAYREGETPDPRHAILYRCAIERIEPDRLTARLRNGQQDPEAIGEGPFALEHADTGGMGALLHSLHLFMRGPKDKRDLLLGQRVPRRDTGLALSRSHDPRLDPILSRAMQARDYFLLMGPPGTGKTSRATRFIVEEATRAGEKTLLMSYTNRAVDEICAMLADNGFPFIRVGNELACEERFRPYLFSTLARQCPKLDELKRRLRQADIMVGTVAALCAKPELLTLRHTDLAIVDEASQVLEPYLVGILSQVGRFILIGDHKQLPAVTPQSPRDTAITDDEEEGRLLRSIGLTDCRDSLFERLLRWERHNGREEFVGVLRWQGRMHPEVADFPNHMFYALEKLEPVPCPHQTKRELPYGETDDDPLDNLLRHHRVIFIASEDRQDPWLSDKVNTDEARVVSEVANRLRRLMGEAFNAKTSVGIIVPYRNQIGLIRQCLRPELADITIDTVERYQGSQRDVIIYSLTARRQWQLDFLTANSFLEDGRPIDRKLNVALTRAREQIIVTGNPHTMRGNSVFARFMDYCKEKGDYLESGDIRAAEPAAGDDTCQEI